MMLSFHCVKKSGRNGIGELDVQPKPAFWNCWIFWAVRVRLFTAGYRLGLILHVCRHTDERQYTRSKTKNHINSRSAESLHGIQCIRCHCVSNRNLTSTIVIIILIVIRGGSNGSNLVKAGFIITYDVTPTKKWLNSDHYLISEEENKMTKYE